MTQSLWTDVDTYITSTLVGADAGLDGALTAATAAGLPAINVAPNQGKFLHLLARAQQAHNILEIGTLAGYSTIWLARALGPGGRVITLEIDPRHAAVAKQNFVNAGVAHQVELRVGPAIETLPALAAAGIDPFDFVFIDADKASIPEYFSWSLQLTRPGGVIIVDNVIRDGKVIDAASDDASVRGVRRLNAMLAGEQRVSATTLQTVGSKGYDGLTMILVGA